MEKPADTKAGASPAPGSTTTATQPAQPAASPGTMPKLASTDEKWLTNLPAGIAPTVPTTPSTPAPGPMHQPAPVSNTWIGDLGLTTASLHGFREAYYTTQDLVDRQNRTWTTDTYSGRMAVRTFSRGVVGATTFSGVQLIADKYLGGYTPVKSFWKDMNVLEKMAKIIDSTAGEGIYKAVRFFTGSEAAAKEAVTFRDTNNFGYGMGRTLGHEIIGITLDMSMMSNFDYMTRDTASKLDPTGHNPWFDNGHFTPVHGAQDLGKNLFKSVTYAGGEDWAVALPYVYFIRGQRRLLNHFSPGFKYDFDRADNGGSFKVGNVMGPDGAVHTRVIGDYQLEGMTDLMSRFTVYNIGTKMFRDAYSNTAAKLEEWKDNGCRVGLPDVNPVSFTPSHIVHTIGNGISASALYVSRTALKVTTYMVPSTFFFYITRAPQSKLRGGAIDPEKGIVEYAEHADPKAAQATDVKSSRPQAINPNDNASQQGNKGKFRKWTPDTSQSMPEQNLRFSNGEPVHGNPFSNNAGDAFSNAFYEQGTVPWYSAITNPIGRFCYDTGLRINERLQPITARVAAGRTMETVVENGEKVQRQKNPEETKKIIDDWHKGTKQFALAYFNAAISYLFYFEAKTEIASARYDTPRTNLGADRACTGTANFVRHLLTLQLGKAVQDSGDVAAGLNEMVCSAFKQPFPDAAREAEAKTAMWNNTEKRSNEADQNKDFSARPDTGMEHRIRFKLPHKRSAPPAPRATVTELRPPVDTSKLPDISWLKQEETRRNSSAVDSDYVTSGMAH